MAALAFSAVASCAAGRGDQSDGTRLDIAATDGDDASVSSHPGGDDTAGDLPAAQDSASAPVDNAPPPMGAPPIQSSEPAGASPQDPSAGVDGCPQGMILVEGEYCPEPTQKCIDWMEDPVQFPYARCRAFEQPSTCKVDRVPVRFCIDRYEASDSTGMPVGDVSWTQAKAACEASGKRLCQEKEWVFACEGEEMRPYPYGYVRDASLCNFDRTEDLVTLKGDLADHREPVTANPDCLSPFGVQNMVGNIDEWVVLDKPHYSQVNGGRKMMSGLKGGWWGPLRNRCRPTTVDHDEVFHELQTGYRCCADAQ